jgi:hypothetical protein
MINTVRTGQNPQITKGSMEESILTGHSPAYYSGKGEKHNGFPGAQIDYSLRHDARQDVQG